MKQYVVDELRSEDYEQVKAYLDTHFSSDNIDGLYWLPVDAELLSEVQKVHTQCQPFYFALELFSDRLTCELLVRTKERVRCDCIQYATDQQFFWLIHAVDFVFERLGIKI